MFKTSSKKLVNVFSTAWPVREFSTVNVSKRFCYGSILCGGVLLPPINRWQTSSFGRGSMRTSGQASASHHHPFGIPQQTESRLLANWTHRHWQSSVVVLHPTHAFMSSTGSTVANGVKVDEN